MTSRTARSDQTERGRRTAANALAAFIAMLWVGGGLLLALNGAVVSGNDWFLWGMFVATGAAYVGSASAIVRRQPSNAVGWLFFLIAGVLAASIAMTEYGIYAIRVSPGSLPAPGLVLALAEPTPLVSLTGIVLVLQLFPNGRPVSGRWRSVLWLTVAAVLLITLGLWVTPHRIVDVWAEMLSHTHVSAQDPLGLPALSGLRPVIQVIGGPPLIAAAFLAVASLFVRRKRADTTQRTQLRWLAYVVGMSATWILVMGPIMALVGRPEDPGGVNWLEPAFWLVATPLVALGIPGAVGIAIVRHRLFDINVVISKTIVYGALAAFISIVYAGVVVGVGQLAGSVGTPALSAVAAAIVALAFQPVRRRMQ